MKLMYCKTIRALILPMILSNRPSVIFAKFLMTMNWPVSCENNVSILFRALTKE